MAQPTIIYLEQARLNRERAAKARRLAQAMSVPDVVAALEQYADELELKARDLEELASKLSCTVAQTQSLTADIRSLITEAQATLQDLLPKTSRRR